MDHTGREPVPPEDTKGTDPMTATAKTVSAALLAAVLSLALFLSPVGVSSAQEDSTDETEDTTTDESTTEDESTDRPGRGDREPLTDEEREALQAEREADRQAFLDDVAGQLDTTSDELVDAFKTAAINRVEAKVEDGSLTQEQADEIISRIEEGDGFGRGFGFGGRGGHHGHRGGGMGAGADDAAADEQEI